VKIALRAVALHFCIILSPTVQAEFEQDLQLACDSFLEEQTLGIARYTTNISDTAFAASNHKALYDRYMSLLDDYSANEDFLKQFNLCQREAFRTVAAKFSNGRKFSQSSRYPKVTDIQFSDEDRLIADARKSALLEDYVQFMNLKVDGMMSNSADLMDLAISREYRLEISRLDNKNSLDEMSTATYRGAINKYRSFDSFQFLIDYSPALYAKFKSASVPNAPDAPGIIASLLVALLALLIRWAIPLAVLVGVFYMFKWLWDNKQKYRAKSHKTLNHEAMKTFGETKEERHKNIIAFFDRPTGNILCQVDYKSSYARLRQHFERNLKTIDEQDRNTLVAAALLYNEGLLDERNFYLSRVALLFGQRQGQSLFGDKRPKGEDVIIRLPERAGAQNAIDWFLNEFDVSSTSITNTVYRTLEEALQKHPDNKTLLYLHKRINGENVWSTQDDLQNSIYTTDINSGYRLGTLIENEVGFVETDISVNFDKGTPVMVYAATGEGKTQVFALPNLLTWKGACVVLDVKGELYRKTSKWRSREVGPVYRFNPLDPQNSLNFNPLSEIRDDPQHIYPDAVKLAWHMIVPEGGASNAHWENSARDILAAAMAVVSEGTPPDMRDMKEVMDILAQINWQSFITRLKVHSDSSLRRTGHFFDTGMNAKELSSILSTARTMLSSWSSDSVQKVISGQSDWSTKEFRSENQGARPPTLYIEINTANIQQYRSVIRTILGVHFDRLYESQPAPKDKKDVLFMLDEMPTLKYMQPIENAFSVGRSCGISLFTIAQSKQQVEDAYPQAKAMLSNAAVRLYMSPKMQDGTAQEVSDELGKKAAQGQTADPNVSPEKLSQGDYKDKIIALGTNSKPLLLKRHYFYEDADLLAKEGELPIAAMRAKTRYAKSRYPKEYKHVIEVEQENAHQRNIKKIQDAGSQAKPRRRKK
jgi:type IV secretion system protein VirD4